MAGGVGIKPLFFIVMTSHRFTFVSANSFNSESSLALEERTGISLPGVQNDLTEAAKGIVGDYFTAIMKPGNSDGTPLIGYLITNVNSSDLNAIKVSLASKYENMSEWPAVGKAELRCAIF
ncbi:hypothetical protein [Paenibacillus sp. SI8]|uniref:hypothetical protein n=1 Tax=unclassified Paenibacillus TaxID=185978 RepID=UPI003467D5D4